MAAPSFIDWSAPGSYDTSTPITIPDISGLVQADDILVIMMRGELGSYTSTGFTNKLTMPTGGAQTGNVLWKRATGSETTIDVSFSGAWANGGLIIVRGCVTTGDPFDVIGSGDTANTSSVVSLTGITTVAPECLVVGFSHGSEGYTTSSGYPPSGYTGGIDSASAAFTVAHKQVTSAGSQAGIGWSLSGTEPKWFGVMFALKAPAGTGSSPPLYVPSRSNRALLRR